jgi:hypothetical protein
MQWELEWQRLPIYCFIKNDSDESEIYLLGIDHDFCIGDDTVLWRIQERL